MFRAVLLEAFDSAFRVVLDDLRERIFTDGAADERSSSFSSSNGTNASRPMKAPPLATLLPQLKSSALRLLPSEGIGEAISEIVSGQ